MDIIILCAALFAIALFVLILVHWKKIRTYFSFNYDSIMNDDDLDGWNQECVGEYYELIKGVHNRILTEMNAMHSRSTSVLAVVGVIITLAATFIVQASVGGSSLALLIIAMICLFITMLFIISAILPRNVSVIDISSHQWSDPPSGSDYIALKGDLAGLKKQMLKDMLICSESEEKIYVQRQKRYAWSLILLVIAVCLIVSSLVLYALA